MRFPFRLALAFGEPSWRKLLRQLSATEYAEWMAYYQVEPWGEERADRRAAIVAATVANTVPRKSKRAAKVEDFMPRYGPEPRKRPKPWQHLLSVVEALNAAMGGKDLRRRPGP